MRHYDLVLDGIWRFVPDPFAEGELRGWNGPDYENAPHWREVRVPSVFDDCGPGMAGYEGTGWFRRSFAVPKDWRGLQVRLRFGAVNYTARVYLNGILVGDNPDGFLPFECDITEAVRYGGENTVVVRADNTRRDGEVPGPQRGWRPYGGILRSVRLLAGDPLRIRTTRLNAWPDGTFVLQATVENGRAETASVTLDMVIEDDRSSWRGAFMETGIVAPRQSAEITVSGRVTGITPWTPENPVLYRARLRLRDGSDTPDRTEIRFGFRRIETLRGRLRLNGQPLLLCGFNRHEDSEHASLCADPEAARQDLLRLKDLGANFVRLCHYPHDEATLALCDEIGLLAMTEIPLYWWGDREENHAAKLAAARRQLTRMIERDFNHPSLVFFSVSNETHEANGLVAQGNAELVRLAKQLDPSRLAVHVSDRWPDHAHFDADDVCCVNRYPTWGARQWGGEPLIEAKDGAARWKDAIASLAARYPEKPILITEFGYPGIAGVHDGGVSEDEQARVIEAEWKAILSHPSVAGATVWCWADHPWAEDDWLRRLTTSPFGVVARDRRSKLSLSVLRRLFRETGDRPQLLLRRPHLNGLPPIELPEGYTLRKAVRSDAEGIASVQQKAFAEMTWGIAEAQQWLFDDESVRSVFVIEQDGRVVATASARLLPDEFPESGYVHWVGADPDHRGKGLGYLVSLATLHEFVNLGCRDAVLHTDDFRVPAIKVYLRLGFRPEYAHATHARRWYRLAASLPRLDLS
ncbi:MAG: GNAT family N-acetyltransferase [Capsulimonadales bacterium]|nr:GNAT family N-acetyltransferase [Capsulimonadales bacterium]